MLEQQVTTEPSLRRFSVSDYHRIAEAGILTEDDRVELIDGEIVDTFVAPPDITVKVVSPEQSVTSLVRRSLWCVANGVQVALLVDPGDRSVLAFRPNEPVAVWRGSDRINLRDVLPVFDLTVEQLFASLRHA